MLCFVPTTSLFPRRRTGGQRSLRHSFTVCKTDHSPPRPSILTARNAVLPRLVPVARAAWRTGWHILMSQLAPSDKRGRYVRPTSSLATAGSSNGSSVSVHKDARLTLYVGVACPWCHRVTLALALLGAEDAYNICAVQPGPDGLWRLSEQTNRPLKDIYLRADPGYTGRFTAPLLIDASDSNQGRLICNESADLVDWLAERHGVLHGYKQDGMNNNITVDLGRSPTSIDVDGFRSLCGDIHSNINDGVYRVGFSTSQAAYDTAEHALFDTLDNMENRLRRSAFLCSDNVVTQADLRLFPTAFRFDAVYGLLFRASRKSIRADYPAISRWLRRMYHLPGVHTTCNLDETVFHYFANLFPLNPGAIVPTVPQIDLSPLSKP